MKIVSQIAGVRQIYPIDPVLASNDALDRPGRPNVWIHCIYLNETWHSGRTSAQDKLVTFRMKRGLVSALAKKWRKYVTQCHLY